MAEWKFSCGYSASLPWGLRVHCPSRSSLGWSRFYLIILSHRSPFSNYKQKSLYGFRASTLVGWVGGDFFKCCHLSTCTRLSNLKFRFSQDRLLLRTRFASTVHILCNFPAIGGHWWVGKAYCNRGQLIVFLAIIVQRLVYGNAPPPAMLAEEDDLEQALALAEE